MSLHIIINLNIQVKM